MAQKDMRDVAGGVLLTALGAFAAWHSYQNYDIGELNRMGPGYFPLALGSILAILGVLIAIPAWFRQGEAIRVEWRTVVLVAVSIALFALTLKTLGLVVATVLAVLASSLADREIRWRGRVMVAAGVALVTYLVFSFGLGMILPVWPWSY
jgi:Ca2+/Na+ antiporter